MQNNAVVAFLKQIPLSQEKESGWMAQIPVAVVIITVTVRIAAAQNHAHQNHVHLAHVHQDLAHQNHAQAARIVVLHNIAIAWEIVDGSVTTIVAVAMISTLMITWMTSILMDQIVVVVIKEMPIRTECMISGMIPMMMV